MAEEHNQEQHDDASLRARLRPGRVIRHPSLWIAAALISALFAGVSYIRPDVLEHVGEPLRVVADVLNPGSTEHLIVISIDGLRPDAIQQFDAETLQRLMRNGRYTLRATTIVPAKTLPSHSSMLSGVQPAVHGITWNEDETGAHGYIKVPTIFHIARNAGIHTAAFFSKTKFEHLALPEDFDYIERPRGGILNVPAEDVENAVQDYLEDERPELLFIHIADVDFAGHRFGWMSYLYGRAVRTADAAVEDILDSANEAFGCGNYTVIITADHGGHGTNHGDNVPTDMLIPWITWGKAVSGTGVITDSINTTYTAATSLWLLGVAPPTQMTGKVVRRAYRPPPLIRSAPLEAPVEALRGCPDESDD